MAELPFIETTQTKHREGHNTQWRYYITSTNYKKGHIKDDDVHCGVAATQSRLKLQGWWSEYSEKVEDSINRCPKCDEIKD